jgi:N,N'-diacetyllegionaminate synthase
MKIFVIAEAGVNHNGDIRLARKMIALAARAGADAVKFQAFKAKNLASKYAPKADYQKQATGASESQQEMLKGLELSRSAHARLLKYAAKNKITYLCSPFDLEGIDLLAELGLKTLKIPSGEITNLPYLKKIGALRKEIILSTGMANLNEIKTALSVLAEAGTPKEKITVLHCNTEYPTPFEDVNLLAMLTIRDKLRVNVGYSDHTPGTNIPIAAAALGAKVIEKHFTLDKNMPGPDHKASLGPDELSVMVKAIRNIEKALGDGIKRPSASEIKNIPIARKSIVAKKDIGKGEAFTKNNITIKRPGSGVSAMLWDKVIGRRAKKGFKEDELIEL